VNKSNNEKCFERSRSITEWDSYAEDFDSTFHVRIQVNECVAHERSPDPHLRQASGHCAATHRKSGWLVVDWNTSLLTCTRLHTRETLSQHQVHRESSAGLLRDQIWCTADPTTIIATQTKQDSVLFLCQTAHQLLGLQITRARAPQNSTSRAILLDQLW